jgi:anti-sigma factor RsiW
MRPRRARARAPERAVALTLAALVVGGCATVHVASPLDDPRAPSTTTVKRCSPSDPDRSVWFCQLGQLLYNLVGAGQVDGGYTIR